MSAKLTMLEGVNSSKKKKNILDKVLHLLLNNKDMVSMLRGMSAAELLRKLQSGKIDKTAKFILLGLMISEMLDKMNLSDFAGLFDKAFSQPPGSIKEVDSNLSKHRESFTQKYKIRERDKLIITKIIEGIPLKKFKDELGISQSNANKKIRALWQRLGLKNREQLIFVAGWMRLISTDLACLDTERK